MQHISFYLCIYIPSFQKVVLPDIAYYEQQTLILNKLEFKRKYWGIVKLFLLVKPCRTERGNKIMVRGI